MSNPIHGNYHGYYMKRQTRPDPRLALVPPDFFLGQTVLDIGCNEGWVTCEVAQRGAKKITGVDIDEELIRAAWSRRRKAWSLQQSQVYPKISSLKEGCSSSRTPSNKKRKRGEEDGSTASNSTSHQLLVVPDYFPASLAHSFGALPIPEANSSLSTLPGTSKFPHNVGFRTANWVIDEIHEDKEGYDVVLAFSITKWVHLNGGDDGIRGFFNRIYSVLNAGGRLLMEPQAWDGYAKASRINPKLKENMEKLQLRPEDFPEILKQIGFEKPQALGLAGERGFRRPVQLYLKPC